MKKILSLLLAACLLGCCLLPAFAAEPVGKVSVRLNSNIAGCTRADYEQMFEIVSGNVVYSFRSSGPVSISDYAGTPEYAHMTAGRTYYLDYVLDAAEGYEFPEKLADEDLEIECGEGVRVYNKSIVVGPYREENGEIVRYKGLRIQASVVVDGNVIQRIIGFFTDMILKIKAWSLY